MESDITSPRVAGEPTYSAGAMAVTVVCARSAPLLIFHFTRAVNSLARRRVDCASDDVARTSVYVCACVCVFRVGGIFL